MEIDEIKTEEMIKNELLEDRPSSPTDCAICLEHLTDKSFTNSCLHMFCFHCLLAWSKVKAECPLCKQDFYSIIHNIRSVDDYDIYHVPPTGISLRSIVTSPEHQTNVFSEEHDFFSNSRRFFSYRTTFMGNVSLPRLTTPNLVIQPYVDNLEIQRDYPIQYPRTIMDQRKDVYLRELTTIPPPSGNRYRECSPDFYRENESQVHRLGRWLHRELDVLSQIGLSFDVLEVLQTIMNMLPMHNIHSSVFRSVVNRYLGRHTCRFIQEFYNFAIFPFDLERYDTHSVYTRQQNGPQLSFIITVDRDDNEDIQVIPNTSNFSTAQSILNETSQTSCYSNYNNNNNNSIEHNVSNQISAPLNTDYHRPSTSFNRSASQSVICISDSEIDDILDDCLIIDEVKAQPETIVLDNSDDECQTSHIINPTRQPSVEITDTPEDENETLPLDLFKTNFTIDENLPNVTSKLPGGGNNGILQLPKDTTKCKLPVITRVNSNKKKCIKHNKREYSNRIYHSKKRRSSSSSSRSVISTDISSDDETCYKRNKISCNQNDKCKSSLHANTQKCNINDSKVNNVNIDELNGRDGYSSIISTDISDLEDDLMDLDWTMKTVVSRKRKNKKFGVSNKTVKRQRKINLKNRRESASSRKLYDESNDSSDSLFGRKLKGACKRKPKIPKRRRTNIVLKEVLENSGLTNFDQQNKPRLCSIIGRVVNANITDTLQVESDVSKKYSSETNDMCSVNSKSSSIAYGTCSTNDKSSPELDICSLPSTSNGLPPRNRKAPYIMNAVRYFYSSDSD